MDEFYEREGETEQCWFSSARSSHHDRDRSPPRERAFAVFPRRIRRHDETSDRSAASPQKFFARSLFCAHDPNDLSQERQEVDGDGDSKCIILLNEREGHVTASCMITDNRDRIILSHPTQRLSKWTLMRERRLPRATTGSASAPATTPTQPAPPQLN